MKTKLAKQSYFKLVLITLLIGGLIFLILLQSDRAVYQLNDKPHIMKLLNNKHVPIRKYIKSLESVAGIKVRSLESLDVAEQRGLLILNVGEIHHPLDWKKPFIVKNKDNYLLVTFSYINSKSLMFLTYIFVMLILVAFLLYSFYLVIKRMEKINLLAENAVYQLSRNVNSQIILPTENEEVVNIYNNILQIQDTIRQIIQRKTQVLAAISHDLKTPITKIKLRVELLEEGNQRDALIKDIEFLEKMVLSIINFSKNSLHEENSTEFNMSDLIDSICEDNIEVGNRLEKSIEENILYKGKIVSLKRALNNILDNAFVYGKKEIKVRLYMSNENIICEISDKGMGIDSLEFDRVFEPFYRVDQARNSKISGSGLGLSIAKEIIEDHGGRIKLKVNVPSGLIVKITFYGNNHR